VSLVISVKEGKNIGDSQVVYFAAKDSDDLSIAGDDFFGFGID
jgi:hypothetical protein